MAMGSILSGAFAYYIFNGGKSGLYFDLHSHGVVFSAISIVAVFLVTDFCAYWAHRIFHTPRLFKLIHKWHHRYGAPTPFTVTAMHPVEFMTYQTIFLLPSLFVPMHAVLYYGLLIYVFYYNVCDHSGIHHRALAPWHPPSRFHDDHHRYFHCNFGQSLLLWEQGLRHDEAPRPPLRRSDVYVGAKGRAWPRAAPAQANDFVRVLRGARDRSKSPRPAGVLRGARAQR